MAGGQERVLRRRIKSVESTKKITRSFELIAASQIVRAQGRIAGSRPYIKGISDILAETASVSGNPTRLVGIPESPQSILTLVMVADRGLAHENAPLRHRAVQTQVGHDGDGDRVPGELTSLGKVGSKDDEQLVAGADAAFVIDRDQPVCVAVECETELGPVFDDGICAQPFGECALGGVAGDGRE